MQTIEDSPLTLEQLEIREREQKALSLRQAGVSHAQIANQLKISVGQSYRDVKNALNRNIEGQRESNTDRREINIGRLEFLLRKLMPHVVTGEGKSAKPNISVAREVRELVAELNHMLGLYAPNINVNLTIDIQVILRIVELTHEMGGDPNMLFMNMLNQLEFAKSQLNKESANVISIQAGSTDVQERQL